MQQVHVFDGEGRPEECFPTWLSVHGQPRGAAVYAPQGRGGGDEARARFQGPSAPQQTTLGRRHRRKTTQMEQIWR